MTFQAGQSGNPNGRPKGIIDKRAELRGLLEPHAKDLIKKVIEFAKQGDPTAMRLCIERLLPRVKVAVGDLSLDEARKFTDFIDHQRHVIEGAERKKKDEQWRAEMGIKS